VRVQGNLIENKKNMFFKRFFSIFFGGCFEDYKILGPSITPQIFMVLMCKDL
jgi:hypothetical protein